MNKVQLFDGRRRQDEGIRPVPTRCRRNKLTNKKELSCHSSRPEVAEKSSFIL